MRCKKTVLFIFAFLFTAGLFVTTSALACSPGDKAEVLWKGSWYPAHALKGKGAECYIHYDGYANSWDEWVGPDRLKLAYQPRFGAGDAVQVLWKGSWWPAHVLKVKGSQLKIHYDGYDSSWDEWVGPDRYR